MTASTPAIKTQKIKLSDYRPSDYLASSVALKVDVKSLEDVRVTNVTHFSRNFDKGVVPHAPLVLNGPKPSKDPFNTLVGIKLNGKELTVGQDYTIDPETGDLTIQSVPKEPFSVEVQTKINPAKNKSGSGLYTSDGMLCTQCESQGFRNITYGLDRPDVFSVYSVTMEANKKQFPQLLCNGVPNVETDVGEDRHRVVWQDLRPKPSYLFAMAALDGDLIKDEFTYPDGQKVALRYYTDKGKGEQAKFAMQCLKDSMQHEYEAWGHTYHGTHYQKDKSLFMTLAISGFNMGAMENNGLNVFLDRLALANPTIATDMNHYNVARVVNHEYDHDETGNWKIPANWFQLAYKEGLTVFRDQTYGAARRGETIERIGNVKELRARVFVEDDGPHTHPIVVPDCDAIDNLYDGLTYPKAAHINRMLQTLVGKEVYREAYKQFHNKKSDDYANRSPESCTIYDYFSHIGKVAGKDLTQFIETWTGQSGVPALEVDGYYNQQKQEYVLKITQKLKPDQKPYHVPFKMGLLDKETGKEIPLKLSKKHTSSKVLDSSDDALREDGVLEIKDAMQTFVFKHVNAYPIMSLNRDFEAYAKLSYTPRCQPSPDDLVVLALHDSNPFKRWDAMQELSMGVVQSMLDAKRGGKPLPEIPKALFTAYEKILADDTIDSALKAEMLTLPSQSYIANIQPKGTVDPRAIDDIYTHLQRSIAEAMPQAFNHVYKAMQSKKPYEYSVKEVGRRALMNSCLDFLVATQRTEYAQAAFAQFERQMNQTDITPQANYNDAFAALSSMSKLEEGLYLATALGRLEKARSGEHLVMNDWLRFSANAPFASAVSIKALTESNYFDLNNTSKVRAVFEGFIQNVKQFHASDESGKASGAGYQLIADQIADIDSRNPQVAARLTKTAFAALETFVPERQALMAEALQSIVMKRGDALSVNVGGAIKQILDSYHEHKKVGDVELKGTVMPQLPRYQGYGGTAVAG